MFYQLNNQYVVKQQYNCCTYVPHSLVFIPVKNDMALVCSQSVDLTKVYWPNQSIHLFWPQGHSVFQLICWRKSDILQPCE